MPECEAHPVDVWLRRLLVLALVVLLGMTNYFLWRVTSVVGEVERAIGTMRQNLDAVGRDVTTVTSTVADIAEDVQALKEELNAQGARIKEALPLEEAGNLLGEAAEIKAGEGELDEQGKREIAHLLNSLKQSGRTVQYGDTKRSAAYVALKFGAKYRLYARALDSAEEFIERVAGRTMTGKVYYLLGEEENKEPLAGWMREKLTGFREKPQEGEPE